MVLTAKQIIDIAAERGLRLALGPWCSPESCNKQLAGLLVIRPSHVPRDMVTPALCKVLKSRRRDIVAELLSRESPHG